jgi:hypothetical protein
MDGDEDFSFMLRSLASHAVVVLYNAIPTVAAMAVVVIVFSDVKDDMEGAHISPRLR